jgi:MraZ protein
MAFRGTFEHTLDDRGRVALPARYRQEFLGGVVLTIGPEGCIEVYTLAGFDQMSDDFASAPATTVEGRRSRRRFDAQSFDTELDRQGRVLVPARFRQMAGLNGAVVIIGRRECLEIWNPDRWAAESAAAMASPAAADQEQG